MITVQKERELTRHPETTQYSVWISIKEDDNETEFIYIFSHLYRAWFLKTDEEVLEFVNKLIDWHLSGIIATQLENNKTIFDNIRYRFVFQITKEINEDNRIGFTDDKSEDTKIQSFYYSNPDDVLSF